MVTLAAAELGARAITWSAPFSSDSVGDRMGTERYSFNFDGPGDLMPGQDGHWMIWWRRPYHVETKSQGFRSAEEPDPAARRIVAIGDSITFGPYVASEDTWPAWTQSELRRLPDARPVQVFNGGVSGYTMADELAWLRDKGVALKPDLLVLCAFENDINDYRRVLGGRATRVSGTQADGTSTGWMARLRVGLWQNSALYNVASSIRRKLLLQASGADIRRGEGQQALQRPEPNAEFAIFSASYARDFRQFARVASEAGIPLAVVSIPSFDTIVAAAPATVAPLVAKLTEELGIPFLDLAATFGEIPDPAQSLYLLQWNEARKSHEGNGHLSRFGNLVAGRAVARWIADLKPVR